MSHVPAIGNNHMDPFMLAMLSPLAALIIAILVFLFVYFGNPKRKSTISDFVGHVVLGSFLLGGIFFLAGFFGPILYSLFTSTDSPQGPLLGFFFTGPIGVAVGILLGTTIWAYRTLKQ
jgi:hypothetical protein